MDDSSRLRTLVLVLTLVLSIKAIPSALAPPQQVSHTAVDIVARDEVYKCFAPLHHMFSGLQTRLAPLSFFIELCSTNNRMVGRFGDLETLPRTLKSLESYEPLACCSKLSGGLSVGSEFSKHQDSVMLGSATKAINSFSYQYLYPSSQYKILEYHLADVHQLPQPTRANSAYMRVHGTNEIVQHAQASSQDVERHTKLKRSAETIKKLAEGLSNYRIGSSLSKWWQNVNGEGGLSTWGCSDASRRRLKEAIKQADAFIEEAIRFLDHPNSMLTDHYQEWFGAPSHTRWRRVRAVFRAMRDQPRSATYVCVPGPSLCYACVLLPPRYIYIYREFWMLQLYGCFSQSSTIVHEVSHMPHVGPTTDRCYGDKYCRKLAQRSPNGAVLHADNYAYFVCTGRPVGPDLELRLKVAAEYEPKGKTELKASVESA